MDNQVFRKKSLDRANSPDALNNTIQVIKPSVWIALLALVLVFVGFLVWAIYGQLNSTVDTVVVSNNGNAGCYVSEANVGVVTPGMTVVCGDDEYELGNIDTDRCCPAYSLDDYTIHMGKFDEQEYLYYFAIEDVVPQGIFGAYIITERINAISFLWN